MNEQYKHNLDGKSVIKPYGTVKLKNFFLNGALIFCLVSLVAETHNETVSLQKSLASCYPFHVFFRAGFGWPGESWGCILSIQCVVFYQGDLGFLACVGAWGGLSCLFCWGAQLQLTKFREEQLLPVIFAPEKAAQQCVSTDCCMPVVARPFLSCIDLLRVCNANKTQSPKVKNMI